MFTECTAWADRQTDPARRNFPFPRWIEGPHVHEKARGLRRALDGRVPWEGEGRAGEGGPRGSPGGVAGPRDRGGTRRSQWLPGSLRGPMERRTPLVGTWPLASAPCRPPSLAAADHSGEPFSWPLSKQKQGEATRVGQPSSTTLASSPSHSAGLSLTPPPPPQSPLCCPPGGLRPSQMTRATTATLTMQPPQAPSCTRAWRVPQSLSATERSVLQRCVRYCRAPRLAEKPWKGGELSLSCHLIQPKCPELLLVCVGLQ